MKSQLKSLLPKPVFEFLRKSRRQYLERRYFKQGLTTVKCGAFELEVPRSSSYLAAEIAALPGPVHRDYGEVRL